MPCPGPRLWPGVAVGLSLDATGYSAPRSTGLRRGSAARRWRLRPPLSQHSGVLGGSATCAPWRALCTRVRSPGPVGSSRPPTTTVHRISRSTAIAVTPRSLSHHIHRITQRASHRCPRHHRPDSTREIFYVPSRRTPLGRLAAIGHAAGLLAPHAHRHLRRRHLFVADALGDHVVALHRLPHAGLRAVTPVRRSAEARVRRRARR